MNFKDLSRIVANSVREYSKKNNFIIDENFALLKIYDDVGELSQAILINKKGGAIASGISENDSYRELSRKLADLMSMMMVLADIYHVDVEKEIGEKMGKELK
jgi:NTP pyrophosphatase (non-canonical NTP hydrolase)